MLSLKLLLQMILCIGFDPTNYLSMSQVPFEDIADRMALVLDEKKPSYEKIPSTDPNVSFMLMDQILSHTKNENLLYETQVDFAGFMATPYTGLLLYRSQQQIKDEIYHLLSFELAFLHKDQQLDIQLPDLTTRIVKSSAAPASFFIFRLANGVF